MRRGQWVEFIHKAPVIFNKVVSLLTPRVFFLNHDVRQDSGSLRMIIHERSNVHESFAFRLYSETELSQPNRGEPLNTTIIVRRNGIISFLLISRTSTRTRTQRLRVTLLKGSVLGKRSFALVFARNSVELIQRCGQVIPFFLCSLCICINELSFLWRCAHNPSTLAFPITINPWLVQLRCNSAKHDLYYVFGVPSNQPIMH